MARTRTRTRREVSKRSVTGRLLLPQQVLGHSRRVKEDYRFRLLLSKYVCSHHGFLHRVRIASAVLARGVRERN